MLSCEDPSNHHVLFQCNELVTVINSYSNVLIVEHEVLRSSIWGTLGRIQTIMAGDHNIYYATPYVFSRLGSRSDPWKLTICGGEIRAMQDGVGLAQTIGFDSKGDRRGDQRERRG